jgi:hypothetical protein
MLWVLSDIIHFHNMHIIYNPLNSLFFTDHFYSIEFYSYKMSEGKAKHLKFEYFITTLPYGHNNPLESYRKHHLIIISFPL